MSSTVDNRVVDMGFNNAQFEKGVKQSTKSLDSLKKSLDLSESAKGLNSLNAASKNVSLTNIADGVKSVSSRFSMLGIIGMTALANLANAAVNYGKKMMTGFVKPLKEGFAEYETQMNAIQTVLANTESKGTTLIDVGLALDELNTYADKTIYNFTEMTKNIGTFTAAGVDLETSVSAIKGIANLAAVSGSNSQQAATAMYQLSQALSSGTVKLMDWNSVVNAGMGGQVFQDALVETARLHGVSIDQMIESEGSFRNTLASGWLTSEVLLDTLSKFTGDLTEAQLESLGYNEEQIKSIMRLGEMANDAATKVKTFTQLKDTLDEALASGWTKSWQIIIGDFEEAKSLFTEISDVMGAIIQNSSDARNAILQGWKDAGGRAAAIDILWNSFNALQAVMAPIKEAMSDIFPAGDMGLKLAIITAKVRAFTETLIINKETADKVRRIFSGVFAIFAIGRDIIMGLLTPLMDLASGISVDGGGLLDFLANLGDHIVEFQKTGNIAESISNALYLVIARVKEFSVELWYAVERIKEKIKEIRTWFEGIFEKIDLGPATDFFDKVEIRLEPLTLLAKATVGILGLMLQAAAKVLPYVFKLAGAVAGFVSDLAGRLRDAMGDVDFIKLFDMINTALIGGLIFAIQRFVTKGGGLLDEAGGMFEGITDVLDGVRGSLQAWQMHLKAKALLLIAVAIAVLAISLTALAMIDSAKLTVALAIVTALFVDLIAAMAAFGKIGGGGFIQALGLIALAGAILILTAAMAKLAEIDPGAMQRGLGAIYALTATMIIFSKLMSGTSMVNVVKGAVSLSIYAIALLMLARAVKQLGALDQETLTQGLIGVGALLAEIAIFMRLLGDGKTSIAAGLAMIGMAAAIMLMAESVERFGKMDVAVLQQGLMTLGVIFAEIAAFTRLVGDGKRIIATAIGMTIIAAAMYILVDIMTRIAKLSWEEIAKGLVGMGGALLIIAVAVRALPKNMLIQSIALVAVAAALSILANVLEQMGGMDWLELGKGLLALGASLLIITIALYAMSGTLAGSFALIVAAGALFILVNVLKMLGSMSLVEIGLALLALAGVFLILGIAGALLTPVIPSLLGLGASMFLIGAGLALVGAGIFLFATGLGLLAASGTAAAIVIVAMVTTILGLVPIIINTLIDTLIIFAEGIIRATPVVEKAITGLLLGFLQIIIDVTPKLYEALDKLLDALVQLIEDHVPEFIRVIVLLLTTLLEEIALKLPDFLQAGWDILIGFLEGIRDNIGEVVTVVVQIITTFLGAVAENLPDIIQSGWDLMLAFINGLADGVDDNLEEILTAIGRLAAAIIDGLIRGIAQGAGLVIAAVVQLAKDAFAAAMKFFEADSPSKKFMWLGKMIPLGLVKGIKMMEHHVPTIIKKLAKTTVNAMSDAITAVSEGIEGEMDLDPTIRPIVDMTEIVESANLLNDMLGGDRSIGLVSTVARTSRTPGVIAVDTDGKPVNSTNIELNQYNYSPKALSRVEIYRQTRNQLRGAKGLLGL
jgi:tape measure domain-containing protein